MNEERIDDPQEVAVLLRGLAGAWQGTGRGRFPTIDDFRYRETLSFTAHETEPHLHYEQRTWLVSDGDDDGDPSHWESGFVMAAEDGAVELLNAQQSGRVEVLSGWLHAAGDGRHELRLESIIHAHDARLVATRRVLTFGRDELVYEVQMATDQVPLRQVHLEARLTR